MAVSASSLSNATPGVTVVDVLNGTQPGGFGWLTWAGSPSEPALVSSLAVPGNSLAYVNPDDSSDRQVSVGDWIQARPGVSNSKAIRDALDALKMMDITVPVWDAARGQGDQAAYRVVAFARIRLLNYRLPGQNRITARFLGLVTCAGQNTAPVVNAGPDLSLLLPASAVLTGRVSDDGLPEGGSLTQVWSVVSGPGTVVFSDSNAPITSAIFEVSGTYVLRLTASDSQLSGADELVVLVNRENHPPVAGDLSVTNDEDSAVTILLPAIDPDGDALTYLIDAQPLHGSVSWLGSNAVRYLPVADYSGPDFFTFHARDGALDSAIATVGVVNRPVNDAPVADSVTTGTDEDVPVEVHLSGSDVEGASLSFTVLTLPASGFLTNTGGIYLYSPNSNFHGSDSFTYVADDGLLTSLVATVSITVTSINDRPIVLAGPDQLLGSTLAIASLSGAINDAEFSEGGLLTTNWTLRSGPGVVSFSHSNMVETTATFSAPGVYVLQLTADDGWLMDSDELTITVNQPPFGFAGVDQTNTFPTLVQLSGAVVDADGVPANGVLTVQWMKVDGAGEATFGDSHATNTLVSFSDSGIYRLRLTVSDSLATTTDDVVLTINRPPLVDAGSDVASTNLQFSLHGTVNDDGIPVGVAAAPLWTKVSGPGEVTFENVFNPATSVTFGEPGVYVLRLQASDSLEASSDEVVIRINAAPWVLVGADQTNSLNQPFLLPGAISDDNLPLDGLLSSLWTVVSGPGPVGFGDAAAAQTGVTFFVPGVYVLRLTASDSELWSSDEVSITVLPSNQAPTVSAGQGQWVVLPAAASLTGAVTDDDLPLGSSLHWSWSKVSGPGVVNFADSLATNTLATFSSTGNYVLRLTASDSELSQFAQVTVAVRTPAMNEPPNVNAGEDTVVGLTNLVTLAGTVADDGLPQSALVTVQWTKVSGPGTVTFANATATNTPVSFGAQGTYVLRLTASDSALARGDDVTITVYPHNLPPVVDAGPDQSIMVPDPALLSGLGEYPTNPAVELSLGLSSTARWSNGLGQPGLTGGSPLSSLRIASSISVAGSNVYVAGIFSAANGVSASGIARWNGSHWFPLYDPRPSIPNDPTSPPIGFGVHPIYPNYLQSVATLGDEVFVRGYFDDLNRDGFTEYAARWTGTGWESWYVRFTNSNVSSAGAVAAGPSGVYLGGDWGFITNNVVDGQPIGSYGIARWDGTNFQALGRGVENGRVQAIAVAPNGEVYAAGRFVFPTASGVASNIARWTGTNWQALGTGLSGCAGFSCQTDIHALAVDDRGRVYAGGNFTSAGSAPAGFIARWDGASWSTLGSGPQNGLNGLPRSIATYGRDVYVGGEFSAAGGFAVNKIARWNGQLWSPLGGGPTNGVDLSVECVAASSQGVYVGGNFSSAGGFPAGKIAFWEFAPLPQRGAELAGLATDDGLPLDASLSLQWTQVAGPGDVSFSSPTNALTSARFSIPGTYILRLTASDSDLEAFDDVTVEVRGNAPPAVRAGADRIVGVNETILLEGAVTDDGFPENASLAWQWSVAGAGDVSAVRFEHRGQTNGMVRFTQGGTYVLRLTANDSQFSALDDVVYTVIDNNGSPFGLARTSPTAVVVGQVATLNAVDLRDDGRPYGLTNLLWSQASGPAPLRLFDVTAATAQAVATVPGAYQVRLDVNDGELTYSSEYHLNVSAGTTPPNDGNLAPTVSAGTDRTAGVFLPLAMSGIVTDDGLPGGQTFVAWSKVSGPGNVHFDNAASLQTTVRFFVTGTYVLRLVASDGRLSASDEVTVTVITPTNQPPFVIAGPDVEVVRPAAALLEAWFLDDLLPSGYAKTFQWSLVSGPGTVNFNPASGNISNDYLNASATFSAPGEYRLRIAVSDSEFTDFDELVVTVIDGTNAPPTANAGPDLTVVLPNSAPLLTEVRDDGLPGGLLEFNWITVSGPAPVFFNNINGQYHAGFVAPGDYVLRLVATDYAFSVSDEVRITVLESIAPPTVAILSPLDAGTVTAPTVVTGTVSSVRLQSWTLEYRLRSAGTDDGESPLPGGEGQGEGEPWIPLATANTTVTAGPLATFDPTLLLNGIYELRLSATDILNRTSTIDPVTVIVDRNMKIGHFTLSFNDLTIPVAGIPIQVTRTYDSRDKRVGDFGVGWTLDLKNIRLQKNRNLGLNWEQTSTGGGFANYSLNPRRDRVVTITFPDGRAQKFKVTASPDTQFGAPITGPDVVYEPLANTRGSLVSMAEDLDEVLVSGFLGPVELLEYNGNVYNPSLFQYTSDEGETFVIHEREGLRSMIDRNGNTLLVSTNGITWTNTVTGGPSLGVTFQRDTLGRITNILDAASNSMTYRYDTNGNLITFVDRVNLTNTFTYDNRHQLLTVADPRGIQAVRNEYDVAGRLLAQVDASGKTNFFTHDLNARREILTDRLGNVTTHWYDDNGNVLQTQDALGHLTQMVYDANDNLLEQVDALGHTNRFTYDTRDNKLTDIDPLGFVTRYTYDAFNQVTSIQNARGFTMTNLYDGEGNLIQERDALGHLTTSSYDGQGNMLTRTDALGNVTSNRYDSVGRVIETVVVDAQRGTLNRSAFAHDTNGNQTNKTTWRTSPTGVEALVTTMVYDSENRLVLTIHPDGSTNAMIYNGIDKPEIEIDPLGRQTQHFYDDRGNRFRTVYADGTIEQWSYDEENCLVAMTDKAGRVNGYFHDALGRRFATAFPDGAATTNYFDALGRVIATTDERGNPTWFGYDGRGMRTSLTNALNEVTRFAYDENGNQVAMVDALGRTNRFEFDALNRRVAVVFPDGTRSVTTFDAVGRRVAQIDQSTNTTAFAYDARGLLLAVTNALGHVTRHEYDEQGRKLAQIDALNRTTRYQYDRLGRRTVRRLPLDQVETYAYDALGNLTSRTDFNGRTTGYAYDSLNRLTQKTPDASFAAPPVTFAYNELGLRTNMTDASGATAFRYDTRNRLVEKATSQGTLLYAYDAYGSVTNISSATPDGVRLSYSYDALNRLSAVGDPHAGTTSYGYDPVGNLGGYLLPNNILNFYEYDSLNRLTNLTARRFLDTLSRYTYTVNASGHRATATETLIRNPLNPMPYTVNRLYHYDPTYRLTNETINAPQLPTPGTLNYAYDAVGNRQDLLSTIAEIPSTSYGYDLNDRLTSDTYDDNGNTLTAPGFGMAQPDRYDFENRLLERTVTGKTVTITYDGDGNRVRKTISTATDTVTTLYLVDTVNPTGYAQVLEEHVSTDSQPFAFNRVYTFGHALISQDQLINGLWTVRYRGMDGHGNTRYLTDVLGDITDTYDYDAFGNIIAATGSTPNNFLFTGEQLDPDLGLYFLRARYQDATTGRFWTMDTFEGRDYDPETLHKYLYADANPVNKIDPSGNVSSFIYGREVHRQIGLDFVGKSPMTRLSDRTMGTILGFVSEKFLAKRPDLIDLGTHELYEIKTVLEYPEGLAQLQFYLFVVRNMDQQSGWRAGATYMPPPRIPLLGGAWAVVNPPLFGVITYEVIDPVTLTALAVAQTTKVFSQIGARAGQLAVAQIRMSLGQAMTTSRF